MELADAEWMSRLRCYIKTDNLKGYKRVMENGSLDGLFEINPDRLDEHWVEQARLYFGEAKKLADLRADLERAKAKRDVVAAELDQEIRLDPARHGLEKTTEAVVANAVLRTKRHKRATEAVILAKHAADVQDAAVTALEHKKRALESAVQLQINNLWSPPKVRGDDDRKMDRMRTRAAFRKGKSKQ